MATLTLNRPDRLNALSPPIMQGLLEALPRLGRDTGVGAIILRGAGRAFCAGGDVKSMAEQAVDRSFEEQSAICASEWIARFLHEIPKPTIAMVNGARRRRGHGARACMRFAHSRRIGAVHNRLWRTSGSPVTLGADKNSDDAMPYLFSLQAGWDRQGT